MKDYAYVKAFQKLGFGMFVHFGLYSTLGRGEWIYSSLKRSDKDKYFERIKKFKVRKDWAKKLVKTAKNAGCKYINITTRHHEGFALYDTCGLSDFDAPHSPCGRDLVREFVDECNAQGIVPFFYHTCFDWHYQKEYCKATGKKIENQEEYAEFFKTSDYIGYWHKCVELLCKNYGKIGGFWFDGIWACPKAEWKLDELYAMIRKYQPEAMIINNTGINDLGGVGHAEIDSVTFERGKPAFADCSDRPRAGEMCQTVNDHWGYAEESMRYKTPKELIENLIDCRSYNGNFLLNVGPLGDGSLRAMDVCLFEFIGKWIKKNKNFIYEAAACNVKAENAIILQGEECYYAVVKDVPMQADPNVQRLKQMGRVRVDARILSAEWLDSGEAIEVQDNAFDVKPFPYGQSYTARVAKLILA